MTADANRRPTGYLFRADDGWYLLYYRPRTRAVPVVTSVGLTMWGIEDYLTQKLKMVVKFADADQESWGRTVIKDRRRKIAAGVLPRRWGYEFSEKVSCCEVSR